MTKINVHQNQHQRRVEGRQKIERRVHPAKPIEDRSKPAVGVRPGKSEPQWETQETNSCEDDCRGYSLREGRQLAISSAKKRRANKEEVDRHVRQNEKRHERYRALPFEIERANVCPPRGDPVAAAVNDQEQSR